MQRIARLIKLLGKGDVIDDLKFDVLGQRHGVGGDLWRLIVVFLHTCVEDFLKGLARKRQFTFSSYNDLDFALKRAHMRSEEFKALYPALKQLANRRNRIVHDADLTDPTTTEVDKWNVVDFWSAMLWVLTVQCVFYRVICQNYPDEPEFRAKHDSMARASQQWREYAMQLLKLAAVPEQERITAFPLTIEPQPV